MIDREKIGYIYHCKVCKNMFEEKDIMIDTKYNDYICKKCYQSQPTLDKVVEEAIETMRLLTTPPMSLNQNELAVEAFFTIKQALSDKDKEIERLRAIMKDEEMPSSEHLPLIPYDILYKRYGDGLDKLNALEELNNINETIILMLQFPNNPSFKKEFERLGGGERKQQIIGGTK